MSQLDQMVKALSEASGIIADLKTEITELKALAVRGVEAGEAAIKQRDKYKDSFARYVKKMEEEGKKPVNRWREATTDEILATEKVTEKCPMGHHCSTHCPSEFRLT